MEKYQEMFDKLTTDKALAKKVDDIEAKFAPVKQLVEAFGEAGIEADEDDVKHLMMYVQMKRFEEITKTELDEDLLRQVAGGGTTYCSTNTTYCDGYFSQILCTSDLQTQYTCSTYA